MAETAIIVPVPEAEPAIDNIRRKHTQAGRDAAPAHVTLLYPFTDSLVLPVGRIHEVENILSQFRPFEIELASLRRFPGSPRVLYLAPEPEEPFRGMTAALVKRFPEHPPYGGAHPTVVPHLTVAVADDLTLERAEQEIAPSLPISAAIDGASLLQRGDSGMWFLRHRFSFNG